MAPVLNGWILFLELIPISKLNITTKEMWSLQMAEKLNDAGYSNAHPFNDQVERERNDQKNFQLFSPCLYSVVMSVVVWRFDYYGSGQNIVQASTLAAENEQMVDQRQQKNPRHDHDKKKSKKPGTYADEFPQ